MYTSNIKPIITSCPNCLKPISFTDLILSDDGKGYCPFCEALVTDPNE